MGSGTWNRASFDDYSRRAGRRVSASGDILGNFYAQDMFKSRHLADVLDPYGVVRECCDSEEHPETVPVILALDVTGSMGSAAVEVAKRLNTVMTKLYDQTKDVEFMIMGIGDLAYDRAPIQASQFESDIRIAEQLDQLYFEGGGGGNGFESYTAAWYFALNNTRLDCHCRGKKGLIITMGDEPLNPYLPKTSLEASLGVSNEKDIETRELYKEVTEKFEVYHLAVIDPRSNGARFVEKIMKSFGEYLDDEHLRKVNLNNITPTIINIVTAFAGGEAAAEEKKGLRKLISW